MTDYPPDLAAILRAVADDPQLMLQAHLAIEDELIDMRDRRMFIGGPTGLPANGFVVREQDGSPSDVIRIGTKPGIQMALRAIANHLDTDKEG